jgi:hypothetical protein
MNNKTNSLIVINAGLVLVWPFLERLFSFAGLLNDNNQFKGREEAALAIYMLHYLATGNKTSIEQDLFIPKVLVGWDTELEVPSKVDPGDSILTECDQLLAAIIMHWSALKSTSPDSVRETFLSRSALVEKKDDGWYFIFERRGVDILLNQLPFGISVIKFEWLDYPIWVTW